jgi:type VI secretion system protein ImpL
MQKFIKENMSSLIEKSSNSSGYVWKKYYGEPFAYDENFLEMINSFNMIENMFFSNDGIGFKLFLTPEFLAKDLSVLTINYANKSYSYANGPQEDFIIEWPTTNINKSPVTISYTSKENETNMINFDGEWGLFKFLEKGSISYNDEKGVNIFKIYNDKNILAEYILKTSSLDDKFSFDTFKKLHVFDNIDNSREVNK